ncbi:MAG: DHHA1 domain-containing protein [Candidatus Aenigmarchaeota archaeon]|nr:DHHA1 domain-containing protein [Candidatus Aenigmarchaeota archaeon]
MKDICKLFEKGRLFIRQIEPKDKLFLIYHTDVDGMVSAALTFIALERLGLKVLETIPRSTEGRREIPKDLESCDKAIILDLPLEDFEGLKDSNKAMLIIDHHPSEDMNTEKIVHINPRLEKKEIYQPTSYIVYKLFSGIVDLNDREWLSVIGIVGDFGFEDCRDLLKKWVKVKRKSEILNTKFWRIANKIRAASLELGRNTTLKILISAKTMEELNKNKKILSSYKKYEEIYRKAREEFWKNAKEFKNLNLIISRISKNVGSDLANEISARYPNSIIVLLEKSKDEYKVHARCTEGKVNIGNLMKDICKGGGHRQAAGGKIKAKDLETFEKKLTERLEDVKED